MEQFHKPPSDGIYNKPLNKFIRKSSRNSRNKKKKFDEVRKKFYIELQKKI